MRGKLFLGFLVLATVLLALFQLRSKAEMIPHHGLEVLADGVAMDCLGCHDGSVAGVVSFCRVECNFRSPHSILKTYPPLGKEEQYLPLESMLQEGMKLEDGKITCISCHNLRNSDRFHLQLDDAGRELCFVCHRN